MQTRLFLALACALLLLRLPAVVQPMGADQGLYAYVGERILAGDLPYRDAWDQKPPAIHFTYALMRSVGHADATVGWADFLAAAAVAWLLYRLGRAIGPSGTGPASALLFLLLSNPSFTRLAGIRLRSQCETFIAVAVTAAMLLLARRREDGRPWTVAGAGALFGVAFLFKYNAGIYAAAGVAALWLWRRLGWRELLALSGGFAVPVLAVLTVFAAGGALRDFYDATITYNVRYSGETYSGPASVAAYILTFPVERARVDALWTVGGAGCLVLFAAMLRDGVLKRGHPGRALVDAASPAGATVTAGSLFALLWIAAACVSITVNGSRGLPQYFVQANPALALAAGWAMPEAWRMLRALTGRKALLAAWGAGALVTVGVWRVNQFPKLLEQTRFDARFALGAMPRTEYLARYADDRKYSALAADQLATTLRRATSPSDRVFVFGFSCASYVGADRASASRFFWSRPVIVGFKEGDRGYGVNGLLGDLERGRPAAVALQRKDWAPDVADSADFFLSTPALAGWLRSHYVPAGDAPEGFDLWIRKAGSS
jgi:4-amino-4-deoxy-L-arabinose transferase-like glycosyltransferase